jgi:hypothetical protein
MIAPVKANPPVRFEAVQQVGASAEPCSEAHPFDHERTRIAQREVKVFEASALQGVQPEPEGWTGLLGAVIQVHRRTDRFNTRTGQWKQRTETAYYVAHPLRPAKFFADGVRGHWGIENRPHSVRDVTLKEDARRIRRNPGEVVQET